MADSAARIAEIRQALSSTGKSVSDYSARFAAGEAPEQLDARAAHHSAAEGALAADEVFQVLQEISKLSKDLHGRSVGRNADDVTVILNGLTRLNDTWSKTRESLEQKIEAIRALERDNARASMQAELQTSAAVDDGAVKEAQQRAAALEAALAQTRARVAALEQAGAAKEQALSEATKRAEAAEAAGAEAQEKLAAAEADLMAAHAGGAAATVEELSVSPAPAKSEASLSLSFSGTAVLGATLRVAGTSGLPYATYQWHRVSGGGAEELIGGATRQQYAPEPRDLGLKLACAVTASPGELAQTVCTGAPIADMEGLAATVAAGAGKESLEFNCVVVQRNGEMQDRREVHQLEVLGDRVKLKRGGKTRYKEAFSDQMQVCGARGGGDAAAQGLFLALSPSLVFMLACESSTQRNAAIMIIRERAAQRGFAVLGPKDKPDALAK